MDLVIDRSFLSFEECHNGHWIEDLVGRDPRGTPPDRIIVGTGPGSFAGIRAAIAFATGYALPKNITVLGIPSAAALAHPTEPRAVVGDARQGKFWVALFDGYKLICPIFQVNETDSEKGPGLQSRIPLSVKVISPDDARIGAKLKEIFADRYLGLGTVTTAALHAAALANPALLSPEPRPIYLNPAVRS